MSGLKYTCCVYIELFSEDVLSGNKMHFPGVEVVVAVVAFGVMFG